MARGAGLKRLKLSDQQVVFYNQKAISQTNQRDAAWDHLAKELEKVIARIRKQREKSKSQRCCCSRGH
jgi:hypothetical protein